MSEIGCNGPIAFFGLSANPPTGLRGHAGIVRSIVQSQEFSEVWVAPVYGHIFSSKRNLLPFEDRLEMCRLSMEEESSASCRVMVVDVEREVFEHHLQLGADPSEMKLGSIDTITYIYNKYPKCNIHFILGEDNFYDLLQGRWKDGHRLATMVKLRVVSRTGHHLASLDVDSLSTPFRALDWYQESALESIEEGPDVSSTAVRDIKPFPSWPLSSRMNQKLHYFLHPAVIEYLQRKELLMFSSSAVNRNKRHSLIMMALCASVIGLLLENGMRFNCCDA